jgi:ABC-type multidrug transport system fused ATPase/permease subunit
VLGREENMVERFGVHAKALAHVIADNIVLSGVPRYVLEPIGFGGILGVALYMILTSPNAAATAIPTLALYAFVGYRLLPAMQQIYAAAADVKYALPAVITLHRYYSDTAPIAEPHAKPAPRHDQLRGSDVVVALENVSFTYAGAPKPALQHVSFNIMRGQSLGIVGKSGSGKTTLADIILGLYLPQAGVIQTPEGVLDQTSLRLWHKRLGYVPQHVFLSNASVLENIAFGVPVDQIDRAAVARAATMAQSDEFIDALPEGFDTIIGERGVVLSGGQRQRLGIARALYTDPEVLVFDEATSALDGLTEGGVMDAIHALTGQRTVILIAHRLQTIEACDRIVHLSNGRIIDDGAFHDLVRTSATFREFTNRSAPREDSSERSVA